MSTAVKPTKRTGTINKEPVEPLCLDIMTDTIVDSLPERTKNMRRCPHCGWFLMPKNKPKKIETLYELMAPCCKKSVVLEFSQNRKSFIIS